jgi:SNF family Na+-dependent transporter
LFFAAMVFAAITSFVAITEVLVEALMDRLSFDRKKSTLIICIIGFAIVEYFGKLLRDAKNNNCFIIEDLDKLKVINEQGTLDDV